MNPLAAKTIRQLYFEGRLRQWEIAWLFKITQASVSRIISGHVW
jgi:predicted transcriptional regulator